MSWDNDDSSIWEEVEQPAPVVNNEPVKPPPSTVPERSLSAFNVDPGTLRGCLYRDTYIRLKNHQAFWFHPTYIDNDSTSGFKWTGNVWIAWGTDLDRIVSFQCS